MKNMDDLSIENYDTEEVEIKKLSLAKRAAAAGGTIMLTLGLFNLASCDLPIVMGGAGAWYCSCTEDDCECTEDNCKCTDCKCTKDACKKVK